MQRLVVLAFIAGGAGMAAVLPDNGQAQLVQVGTVEQVWEDGLRLDVGDRTLVVDTWDLYGDATSRYVSVGDQLTITGEFDNGEFDAFTIASASSTSPSTTVPAAPDAPQRTDASTYTGTVEQVWEDGLRLDVGDRTLVVDTWDLYGDATSRYVSVGDQLTITGEFDDGEFDAATITPL